MIRPVLRLPSRVLTVLAALAVLLTMSVPVFAGTGRHIKLDLALQAWKSRSGGSDQQQRVIVHLKAGARAGFVQRLKSRGAQLRREHAFLEDVTIDVPRRGLQSLEDDDDIESISIDAPITPHATVAPTGAVLRSTLGLVSSGPTGSGVGVAVIDSGISSSNAFGSRITAFYDFTGGSAVPTTPRICTGTARTWRVSLPAAEVPRATLSRCGSGRESDRSARARQPGAGLHEHGQSTRSNSRLRTGSGSAST